MAVLTAQRDGADGAWSTFQVQVGSPGQTVRLLPGTSANAGDSTWVILPEGCTANPSLTNCVNERGYTFASNQSSTWSTQRLSNDGLFALDTYEEAKLGLTGNAYYGFDTISLGLPGSGLPTVENQLIAGIATNDFWLGSLALSPIPFNFTNLNDPVTSLTSTLRSRNLTSDTSWAYTAGAAYMEPPVFGSLTLGGYDASRFNASDALNAVPFGADFTRDLLVGVQQITYVTLGSAPLLSQGIVAFIDGMVTQMWLPCSVCQAFEQAFNLTWNDTAELYLLSKDEHASLLEQNPTFTFTFGYQTTGGGKTIDLTMPYAAFDLNISQPYVDEASYYFPLKRADNDTQYTLGRVFLQESYVVADYDRKQFQIGQALFPSQGSAEDLRVLHPPGNSSGSDTGGGTGPKSETRSGLSTGAIVGIVIAGVAAIVLLVIGVLLCLRRRRRSRTQTEGDAPIFAHMKIQPVEELGSTHFAEVDAQHAAIVEIGSREGLLSELSGVQKAQLGQSVELDASSPAELEGISAKP